MTKDEALKLALDVLEAVHIEGGVACVLTPNGEIYIQPTITAIREALAQPNEADELLRALRLDPDTYRTDGGWLNIPKIMAAIESPEDYPHTEHMQPCQNEAMRPHQCANRAQCWEPCGELGHSAEHARPSMRNFCGRCGKRLGSSEHIHTCTPPTATQGGNE